MSYKNDSDFKSVNRMKNSFFLGQAVPRTVYYLSEFLGFLGLAGELVKVLGTLSIEPNDPSNPTSLIPRVDFGVADVGGPLSFISFGLVCFIAYKVWLQPKYEEFKEAERTLIEVYKKSELEKKLA